MKVRGESKPSIITKEESRQYIFWPFNYPSLLSTSGVSIGQTPEGCSGPENPLLYSISFFLRQRIKYKDVENRSIGASITTEYTAIQYLDYNERLNSQGDILCQSKVNNKLSLLTKKRTKSRMSMR